MALQTNADVNRRTVFKKLFPLSFSEFQNIRHQHFMDLKLKQSLHEMLYGNLSLKATYQGLQEIYPAIAQYWAQVDRFEFENYLATATLPFTLDYPNFQQITESCLNLIDKIISKNISSLEKFDSKSLHLLKRILFILADSQDVLSITKLNQMPGFQGMSPITLGHLLEALQKTEILIRVPAYGSNLSKSRKPAKYLFMSPALRLSFLNITGLSASHLTRQGKLLEDAVGMYLVRDLVAKGKGLFLTIPLGAARI